MFHRDTNPPGNLQLAGRESSEDKRHMACQRVIEDYILDRGR